MVTSASVQIQPTEIVTTKVDELNALAWDLRRTDTKRSLALAKEALHLAERAGYESGEAYSLLALGYSAVRASNLQAAQAKVQRAAAFFNNSGDKEGQRRALNTLGIVFGQSGNYAEALGTFLTLQRLCAELGEPKAAAEALNNIGAAYFHLGDYPNALDYHMRALEAFRIILHSEGEISALVNIGMVYFEGGDFEEALSAFEKAHEREGEDRYICALVRNHLGRTHLALGQFERALSHNEASLALMNALEDRLGASYTQDDLAAVHAQLGQVERAQAYLLESLGVKREAGDTKGEAEVCLQLGRLYLRTGRLEAALDTLHNALASAEHSQAKAEVHQVHEALAEAYEKNGQFREACLHLKKHAQLGKGLFDRASDLRLQGLRVRYEVEQTEQEKEIYRLKNVELAQAVAALHTLTTSLQTANDEKSALLEQLERQNREDALTGLYNRRYVDTLLEQEYARARRYDHTFSVVLCDIDHFKRVNDDFSHQMGDEVLRCVAQLLRSSVRQGDTAARYGGEEFILLFPETSAQAAARVVERIRVAVADYPWHTLHPDLKVTLSAGVSDDVSAASHEKLVSLADKKLYEAKRGGRNRVNV